jgi:hypothetical protein
MKKRSKKDCKYFQAVALIDCCNMKRENYYCYGISKCKFFQINTEISTSNNDLPKQK